MKDERDKARAEAVWDERISPTLKGRYTINRGGIVSCIADVGTQARAEGRDEVRAVLLGIVALGEWAHDRTRGAHVQCSVGIHFWDYGPPARCTRCGETD